MKQYICEIIRTDQNKIYIEGYDNYEEHRDFLYINPSIFHGMLGRRYHTIYCDKQFLNDNIGRNFVKEILKPMASLDNGKGIIFLNKYC